MLHLGKTELAKQVARYMHKDIKKVGDAASCIHIDTLLFILKLLLKHMQSNTL